MQSREVRACWRAEPREVRAQNYTLRKERAAQGGGSLQEGQVTHHLQGRSLQGLQCSDTYYLAQSSSTDDDIIPELSPD